MKVEPFTYRKLLDRRAQLGYSRTVRENEVRRFLSPEPDRSRIVRACRKESPDRRPVPASS